MRSMTAFSVVFTGSPSRVRRLDGLDTSSVATRKAFLRTQAEGSFRTVAAASSTQGTGPWEAATR